MKRIRRFFLQLKLRVKYALVMLFDKDFYTRAKIYKKQALYKDMLNTLSRGQLHVNDITLSEWAGRKLYRCNFDFMSLDEEACFTLRRLGYMSPVQSGDDLILSKR